MSAATEVVYQPVTVRKEQKKPGRKSNAEREQIQLQQERAARSAKRIFADTPRTLALLLSLVALLAVASFSVSFAGLYAAAAWAVGESPWLQIAVPVMLDVAIIAFTVALFVERERGESVRWTWVAIAVFATVSAASNVLHTLTVSTATTPQQLIVGSVISGGAPLLLAFATDKAAVKVFRKPEAR